VVEHSARFNKRDVIDLGLWWCRRGDLNPHALAGTSPSSWRVCLFRHFDSDYHFNRSAILPALP
jgi:hypothetical protein